VLYQMVKDTAVPNNPNGCFDWWGYAGSDYCTKSGTQMNAIYEMVVQLSSGAPSLPQPIGLSLLNVSDHSVTVGWQAVAGASSYRVYRNDNNVATVSILWFEDNGLSSGTTYSYHVVAISNQGGQSPPSGTLRVTTTGNPPPLGPVTGLRATSVTATSVALAWNSLSGAASYRVYRNNVQIAQPTLPSLSDSGLQPETTYVYTVRGVTSDGQEGPLSDQLIVETGSSWTCEEYYDNNYNHVGDNRAYTRVGYVYAIGSDDFMGLYNVGANTRLAETSQGYYVVGNC